MDPPQSTPAGPAGENRPETVLLSITDRETRISRELWSKLVEVIRWLVIGLIILAVLMMDQERVELLLRIFTSLSP